MADRHLVFSLLSVVCFCTSAQSEGLVMVIGADGTLRHKSSSSSFARHFGPGGVAMLSASEDEPKDASDVSNVGVSLSTSSAHPQKPSPSVLAAIEKTALNYVTHGGLRAAGMSASDWLALFQANIEIESGYNPMAESHVGAFGLGQLMPETAKTLGVDRDDPAENLDGSARYLLMLLERFQSAELALAGYNAGPEAVERYGGIPPFKETKGHVVKVMAVYQRLKGDNP